MTKELLYLAPLMSSIWSCRSGTGGKDAAILTTGGMVYRAIQACEKLRENGVEVQVFNISCLSDLDGKPSSKPPRQE